MPSDIPLGGASVTVDLDDSRLYARLREMQGRVQGEVQQLNGKFEGLRGKMGTAFEGFGTSFRGADILDTGIKFGAAVAAARASMETIKVFSAAIRGDWEAVRKIGEDLPFGMGAVVKDAAPMVDRLAALFLNPQAGDTRQIGREFGLTQQKMEELLLVASGPLELLRKLREGGQGYGWNDEANKAGIDARSAALAQMKKDLPAMKEAGKLEEAFLKATMTASEYARHEVETMNVSADAAERLIAIKLKLIDLDERKAGDKKLGEELRESMRQAREEGEKALKIAQDVADARVKGEMEAWGAESEAAARRSLDWMDQELQAIDRFRESGKTPEERLADRLREIRSLASTDTYAGLSPEEVARASAAARRDLLGEPRGGGVRGAFNPQAGFGLTDNPAKTIAAYTKRTAEAVETMARIMPKQVALVGD